MKKQFLLTGLIIVLSGLNSFAKEYVLENQLCRITISNNRISSLFDKGRNVEHSAGLITKMSMLKVQLADEETHLNEIDLDMMNVKVSGNWNMLTFVFSHEMVVGTATIRLSDSPGEIEFTAEAKPVDSRHAIARIDFPSYETPNNFDGKEKYCLTPYREGRLTPISVVLSAGNEFNSYFTYPKFLFSQFIGCLGEKGGFLLWTDDKKGYTKEFGRDYLKDASRFAVKHFMQYEYGKGQKLSYNSRITFTGSQWYDAADIYRSWSEDQPWSAVKLKDRTDIPGILIKSTPVVFSGQIDKEDLSTLPSTLKVWKDQLKTPVIYRPLGWEKHGNWNGIDYFPTSTGDEKFKDMAKRLNENDIMVAGFISGYSWKTNTPAMKMYFDENRGAELCETDREGKLKTPLRICRGSNFGKSFLQKTASSMFDLGMTVIHNDVDFGTFRFESEGCFNKEHGHPIPCGLWEIEITRKALQEIKQEAQNRGLKDFIISKEYYTELFNQDIHSSQARFFKILTDPFQVPLAQYLFHDYVFTIFGLTTANAADDLTSMMLISGQVPSMAFWNKEVELPLGENAPQTILLTDYFAAMKSHAKDFLSFGKMLRPLVTDAPFEEKVITEATVSKVEGGSEKIKFDKPLTEKKPLVFQSSWEDDKGNIGVFAFNNQKSEQIVTVPSPGKGSYEATFYMGDKIIKRERIIADGKIQWSLSPGRFCSVVFKKI